MYLIQTLPLPTVGLCTDPELYVRTHGGASYSFADRAVLMSAGDWCSTDTYFGLIPTAKWARHTVASDLDIVVEVEGDVDVEVVQNRPHHSARVVAVAHHESDCGRVIVRLPPLCTLAEGHVFIRVRARRGRCRFLGMVVEALQQPVRSVRLGVSITTFNRQEYVAPNLARLDAFMSDRPDLEGRVRVQLVDNGRNLAVEPMTAVPLRIFDNRNLGGAGGFARGLLELRAEGWASHVLFMDDDVKFEPEIIARVVALLSYTADSAMSISGAMLREEITHRQFEAGSMVKVSSSGAWHAVGRDRNLHDWGDLLANDADEPFDYGAWWCFAFPIDLTDDYPIPVFVRGDDVCFGMKYCRGHIMTINGVGVWHQDFAYKNGPVPNFYEARNIPIVLTLSSPGYGVAAFRRWTVERTMRFVSALKYDTARAFLDGVEAYLDGPRALLAIDADEFHAEVRARYGETLAPLSPDKLAVGEWKPPNAPFPAVLRATSLLTLGGHLVPAALRRGGTRATRAEANPVMASVGANEIVYRHDPTGHGFVARREYAKFAAIVRRITKLNRRMNAEFEGVAAAWRESYPELVSEAYWCDQFARAGGSGDPSQQTLSQHQ